MKYMNNHYGQSKIFCKKKCKMPMNLQMFADGGGEGDGNGVHGEDGGEGEDNTPSYEELATQLAQAKADAEKYKNLNDKSSKEAAEFKKQLRTKLSAEEQESIAKKEAEEAKDARIKELEAKMQVIEYTNRLLSSDIGMNEKSAKEFAEALSEGDTDKAFVSLANHIKAIKDSAYQQALADRPDTHAGNGDVDKNATANEKAVASAKRMGGANMDIMKQYGFKGGN